MPRAALRCFRGRLYHASSGKRGVLTDQLKAGGKLSPTTQMKRTGKLSSMDGAGTNRRPSRENDQADTDEVISHEDVTQHQGYMH